MKWGRVGRKWGRGGGNLDLAQMIISGTNLKMPLANKAGNAR